jgi:hypothetical protein
MQKLEFLRIVLRTLCALSDLCGEHTQSAKAASRPSVKRSSAASDGHDLSNKGLSHRRRAIWCGRPVFLSFCR